MLKATYLSPPTISSAIFNQTQTPEQRLAYIQSFAEVTDGKLEGNEITFRATPLAASVVARSGFDVRHLVSNLYLARRPRNLKIDDTPVELDDGPASSFVLEP